MRLTHRLYIVAILSIAALASTTAFATAAALARAPIPQDTASVHFAAIQIQTFDGQILQGHLATPKQVPPPYPAVLMLVGSGAGNRYEDVSEYVTADGKVALLLQPIEQALLDRGIAVMAYDKRGVSAVDTSFLTSTVNWTVFKSATAENLAADAVSAFDVLATQPQIDSTRVSVLGHSEGTILALKLMERRAPAVNGLFMMGLLTRSMRDIFIYQGLQNPLRYFYALDADGDGYLTEAEYNTAATADPILGYIMGGWKNFKGIDLTGDGRVSLQEHAYALEKNTRDFFALLNDQAKPWPEKSIPREWFQQYVAEGPYLSRQLPYCAKIHLFQGEIDIQTPFEDALELNESCAKSGTPLASFISYPELGHGFSPRVGYKKVRDTIGPIAPKLALDIAEQARKSFK